MKVKTKHKTYDIIFSNNELNIINEKLSNQFGKNREYVILTEKNVPYIEIISKKIEKNNTCHVIKLQNSGEINKSFNILEQTIKEIFKNTRVTRNTILLAIGGGTIGDLGGFIASILMRGIKLVQIPTTLMSMVDSSIGGKTGINIDGYKNMVGTFYQPDLVLCDVKFLDKLNFRTYISGYAEIIKHAMISKIEKNFFEYLIKNEKQILNKDLDILLNVIKKSCKIKANIITQDEFETKKIRNFLNFGHTIAHAIEKISEIDEKIMHGEAVAIGIMYELRIIEQIGLLKNQKLIEKLENNLIKLKLPTKLRDVIKINSKTIEILIQKMLFDKKNSEDKNKIAFSVPINFGETKNFDISIQEIKKALQIIIKNENNTDN